MKPSHPSLDIDVPVAAYRLQFRREFSLQDARSLIPYLEELGITHLYASPLFAARRGSTHGYDVVDPTTINPELGGMKAFEELTDELARRGMGLLLDIVPNHMAATTENPWWRDVLERGPHSPYAPVFDIDWTPADGRIRNQILLPVLGAPYEQVFKNNELKLTLDEDGFALRYYEHRFPLARRSYADILNYGWKNAPQIDRNALDDIKSLLTHRKWLDKVLEEVNQGVSGSNGKTLLEQILEKQFYRLCSWREGIELVNYRRFFDISDLAGVRLEVPQVFEATHSFLFSLAEKNRIAGVRVDHIDGLRDPEVYLQRLARQLGRHRPQRRPYVVVEKILAGDETDETLPEEWPVQGTTGYDFLNLVNRLFVNPAGVRTLTRTYSDFVGKKQSIKDLVYVKKTSALQTLFASEVNRLTHQLADLLVGLHNRKKRTRGHSKEILRQALVGVAAALPVYRTYLRNQTAPATDKRYIHQALREAAARNPALPRPVFAFLRKILLPGASSPRRGKQGGKHESARREFVCRWQQLTGPAMAKGFEDTTLYVYNRLISLNDVGGEPQAGGITSGTFLSRLKTRQKLWPHTLNTTSTHDTKRSEDVRAGINVLSELAPEWAKHLPRWARWNKSSKPTVNGRPVPDPNEEILLYQTLLGSWPPASPLESAGPADSDFNYPERIRSFMVKAAREAKIHSNWLEPNTEYETALCVFVERLLKPSSENRFLNNFLVFQKKIARFGAWNSLSQTLLKLTLPGVPDLYQGNELWDLSLVDPDNRRPVSFERRARYLEELKKKGSENRTALIAGLLRHWEDGRLKLYLTWKALRFRRTHHELFREGEILAVGTGGTCKDHLCAFARRKTGKAGRSEWAVVAVPRLMAGRAGRSAFPTGRKVWGNTTLLLPQAAPTVWKNVLTGERLDCRRPKRGRGRGRKKVLLLGEIFRSFPAALLAPGEEGNG